MTFPTQYQHLLFLPEAAITERYSNSYGKQVVEACTRLGLQLLPTRTRSPIDFLRRLLDRRHTMAMVNWVENDMVDSRGRFRRGRTVGCLCRLLVLRALADRVIYVQHNHYPHRTIESERPRVRRMIGWATRWLADRTVTHDRGLAGGGCSYVPHPVYPVEPSLEPAPARRVVCFGRITPYKNLEALIDGWSSDWNLLIAGEARNRQYFNALQLRARGKNISFAADVASDAAAAALVASCAAAIVSHSPPSMVVSGSLYFALSCGVPVVAVGLAHAKRLAAEGTPGVHFVDTIGQLSSLDWDAIGRSDRRAIHRHAHAAFGPDAVAAAIAPLLD